MVLRCVRSTRWTPLLETRSWQRCTPIDLSLSSSHAAIVCGGGSGAGAAYTSGRSASSCWSELDGWPAIRVTRKRWIRTATLATATTKITPLRTGLADMNAYVASAISASGMST
jgi:hypothetical protein